MNKRSLLTSFFHHYSNKCLLLLPIFVLSACAEHQAYTPEPLAQTAAATYQSRDLSVPALHAWLVEHDVQTPNWPRKTWNINSLASAGEFFSSALAIAAANVAVAESAEITAAQKLNPNLELSSEYHSEKDSGQSPWSLGAMFSWVYEQPEKRQTRVDYAQAITAVATLKSAEIKWQIRDKVADSYLNVLVAMQQQAMLQEESTVLQAALNILERSLALGQISDFELSTTRLALQQSQLAQNTQEVAQLKARTQLAVAVGLQADGLQSIVLDTADFTQLPNLAAADLALENLQKQALISRPDIRRILAKYAVAEADVHREIAKQHPDLTLSPGFIFDQNDNIWALARKFVLPINDVYAGPISEAEARRALKAQEVLALQTRVLQQVHQARIIYQTQFTALHEVDNMITTLKTQHGKLQRQYELGAIDNLSLIHSQLELLTIQRSRYDLEVLAWQAFAGLEDAMMSTLN